MQEQTPLLKLRPWEERMVTTPMEQGTEAWHLWRKGGIGATDASAIFGTSKYSTPLDVYEKKVYDVKPNDDSPMLEWGTRLEHVFIDKFVEENDVYDNSLVRGPCYSDGFHKASLDGFCYTICDNKVSSDVVDTAVVTLDNNKLVVPTIIECKMTHNVSEWNPVPKGYYSQVQWQMFVTGIRRCFFSVWNAMDATWFQVEVPYNEMYANKMVEVIDDFWNNNVLKKIPPKPLCKEPEKEQKAMARLAMRVENTDDPTPFELDKENVAKFFLLKDAAEKATKAYEAHKTILQSLMDSGRPLTFEGKKFAFYVRCKGKETLDLKRLKKEQPSVYKAYINEGNPYSYVRFNIGILDS